MRFLTFLPLLAFLCHCTPLSREIARDREGIPVVFIYADRQAQRVCLAGSFNQWSSQSHCMQKENEIWSLSVPLQPGRYQYLFRVDDQTWKLDPGAPLTEDNGFGSKNSVLLVE